MTKVYTLQPEMEYIVEYLKKEYTPDKKEHLYIFRYFDNMLNKLHGDDVDFLEVRQIKSLLNDKDANYIFLLKIIEE